VVEEFLIRAAESGVKFRVEDGRLKATAPKGAIDGDLAAYVEAHREQIIAGLLSGAGAHSLFGDAAPCLVRLETPQLPAPASFAQERLYFLQQLDPSGTHYHMPLATERAAAVGRAA